MAIEQLPTYSPETEFATLTKQEMAFVQCLANGMTNPEISRFLGINSAAFREQFTIKMISDFGLEETLRRVERLPFVAEDGLSKNEAMVDSLKQLGFKRVEIAKILDLDPGSVGNHLKRAGQKKMEKRDRRIPEINFEKGKSQTLGLIKGIHRVISERLDNFEAFDDMRANLSINESIASLWSCTGRTEEQIAIEMDTSCGSVQTYLKRASKKLGIRGRYPLNARTLLEIMRDQKRARV